jgi:hypothetical protein
MDSHLKASRWVSELGMVFGVGLELITPLVPVWFFLPLATIANTFKGLSALIGGGKKKKCFALS